jgi:hypothetical protein
MVADNGFDADKRAKEPLHLAGKQAVIPPKANRKQQRPYDQQLYTHLIENFLTSSNSSAPSPHARTKRPETSSLLYT